MSRATARIAAMQMIYGTCLGGAADDGTLSLAYDELREEKRPMGGNDPTLEDRSWIETVVGGVQRDCEAIDARISAASQRWAIDRMARVDLAIMRLAVWELLNEADVPGAVVISEAVELANRYSGEGSGRFVNGVLGAILREEEAKA